MRNEPPLKHDRYKLERIHDFQCLFELNGGKRHELIEKQMRALGHKDFHRRTMYGRFERGRFRPGWIETYGKAPIDAKELVDLEERLAAAVATEEAERSRPARERPHRRTTSENFDDFQKWLMAVSPHYQWNFRHQIYIFKKLKRVTDGFTKRLMLFMPPRHGKSEMVTAGYAAYRMRSDPGINIILGSYNQKLANRFSRKTKRLLVDDYNLHRNQPPYAQPSVVGCQPSEKAASGANITPRPQNPGNSPPARTGGPDLYESGSPFPFASKRRANTDAEWETSHGGGMRAVGVGSGVTGFGADLIIIDDPIKSRAEAESAAYRDRVYEWFNDDIYTRLEPDGAIILIQTRWHDDDLAGRLLREAREEGGEQWEVIDLAALAEPAAGTTLTEKVEKDSCVPDDPLGRSPGEALWPERFSSEALDRIRRKLGSYSFAALYQQKPVPAEGGLFKRDWFRIIPRAPNGLRWRRATDPGLMSTATADYTASFRVAFDRENNLYIDGGFRKQIEYPELRRYILGRMHEERDTDQHGVELSAHGTALVQDLGREVSCRGRPLRGIRVQDNKISRALSWIALAEQGKVFLVRASWNRDFIDECCSFPVGAHDDQVDAVSLGVEMTRRSGNGVAFIQ